MPEKIVRIVSRARGMRRINAGIHKRDSMIRPTRKWSSSNKINAVPVRNKNGVFFLNLYAARIITGPRRIPKRKSDFKANKFSEFPGYGKFCLMKSNCQPNPDKWNHKSKHCEKNNLKLVFRTKIPKHHRNQQYQQCFPIEHSNKKQEIKPRQLFFIQKLKRQAHE